MSDKTFIGLSISTSSISWLIGYFIYLRLFPGSLGLGIECNLGISLWLLFSGLIIIILEKYEQKRF